MSDRAGQDAPRRDSALIDALAFGVVILSASAETPPHFHVAAANDEAVAALGSGTPVAPGTALATAFPSLAATEALAALRRAYARQKSVRFPVGYGEAEARPHGDGLAVTLRRTSSAEDTALLDRLELAIGANGIGIWEYLPQQDRLMWTKPVYDLFGVDAEDFAGRFEDFERRLHPQDRAGTLQRQDWALTHDDESSYTFRIVRPDGVVRHLLARARVVERDADGAVTRVLGINQDVTEEHLARRRAEAAEARLLSAVDALPDGFVIYDAEDRLVLCNDRYKQLYAESAAGMVTGATFADIIRYGIEHGQYPEAVGHEAAFLAERLAVHAEAKRNVEQALPGNRWVRIVERRTAQGDTVGFRVDISQLKRQQLDLEAAAQRLRETSREMETFLAVAQDLLSVTAPDGRVVRANAAWREVLGEDAESFIGQRHVDRIDPDHRAAWQAATRQLATGSTSPPLTLRYRGLDGWRWLEWRAMRGDDGLIYGAARDVTEREAALHRQALKAAEEQALSRILRAALSADDERGFLDVTLSILMAELPWAAALRGAGLWLCGAAQEALDLAASRGVPVDPAVPLACLRSDTDAQAFETRLSAGTAPDTALCLALRDGQSVLGALVVSGATDARAAGMDDAFMARLAGAIAVGLAHRRNATALAAERAATMAALGELSSYRAALEQHMVVFETDRDGTILKVNKRFTALTGYDAAELVGQNPRLVNSGTHEPAHFREMWHLILAGEPWQGEICNRARDGELYWVESTIVPVKADDGTITRFVCLQFEITERKRLAEGLLTANRRMERLAAVSGIGGWERDMRTGIVTWDDAMRRIKEAEPGYEPPREIHLSTYPDAARAQLRAAIDRCMADGTPFDLELPMITHKGRQIWIRSAGGAVVQDGTVVKLTGAIQDITERKAREAETERLRARFEAIFENTESIIFLKDREGRFIGANRRFKDQVGRDDVIGKTDFDLTTEDDARRLDAVDRGVFETGKAIFLEETVRRPSGETKFYVSSKFLIDDPQIGDRVLVAIATDVTEMKRRDAENARLRQRFEAFMANTASLIFLKRRDGSFITANKRLLDFLGLPSVAALQGRRSDDFSPPEIVNALQAVDRAVFETGEPAFLEEKLLNRGEVRYFLTSKFLIPDSEVGDMVLCGVATDITEQKRLQASLEASRREADAANLAKSQFLANMSHEIRTPMNGVMGMADLLSRAVSDPQHKRMVEVIRESGEVLLNVINDILDFSKIEGGKLTLETTPLSLREIVRKVESVHALKAAENGIDLVILLGSGVDAPRLGDPHRLQQILHNLVSNAVKFTRSGEVRVIVRALSDERVSVVVQDTGTGMSPEVLERVFDEFAQADTSTTRRFGGTGLGLPIVKGLVEAMGGTLAVESEPDKGSTFTLTLPLPLVDTQHHDTPAAATPQSVPPGLRILGADDNEVNRLVLEAYLRALDVVCDIKPGGAEAVAARGEADFDALMLDISMPGMDGVETLAAIRAHEAAHGLPRIPAIAVTANAMTHQIEEYLAAGFDAHLAKPIRREDLLARLQMVALARAARAPA